MHRACLVFCPRLNFTIQYLNIISAELNHVLEETECSENSLA